MRLFGLRGADSNRVGKEKHLGTRWYKKRLSLHIPGMLLLLCLTRKCMRDDVISTSLSSWEGEEEKSRASFNVFVFFSTNGVIVSFLFYREILLFFLYRCMRKEKKQEESV